MHDSDAMNNDEITPAPGFQAVPPALIEWDEEQRGVIDSPSGYRLHVSAGPGTGKTAVACARVSQLIDRSNLEPSRIWLISFTRTAVREIRDRIATYLEDSAAAYAVKIATLDSHAWTIHSGFDEEAKLFGSYEENIEKVLELVQTDYGVADYLESVGHLVIDEAQDIVGIRADLVIAIVKKLSATCGVTIFADEAQAIYGFADDEARNGKVKNLSLPERVRRGDAGGFKERELSTVHRTEAPRLLTIFSDTRRKVLSNSGGKNSKFAEVKEDVIQLAHGSAPSVSDPSLADIEDAFILYRRRSDVLLAASFLGQKGISYRIRMSGLPVCLVPWIGATMSEYTAPDLTKDTFAEIWASKVRGSSLETYHPEKAWQHLVRLAGKTQEVVDMRLLRKRLGRKQPPAELCSSELGDRGPIVGTIHASKGREADTVHLMLPNDSDANADQQEEARVVFVGATRGRSRLMVGRGYRQTAKRVEQSGRAYALSIKEGKPRAQVEIGHVGDISAEGLAGRRFFESAEEIRKSQNTILSFSDSRVSLVGKADPSEKFSYRLRKEGQGPCLAVLSQSVNADLFKIAKDVQEQVGGRELRPPNVIRHLRVIGIRTIVLPPDAPECDLLREPWASSGILVAPLVIGYTTIYFPLFRKKEVW